MSKLNFYNVISSEEDIDMFQNLLLNQQFLQNSGELHYQFHAIKYSNDKVYVSDNASPMYAWSDKEFFANNIQDMLQIFKTDINKMYSRPVVTLTKQDKSVLEKVVENIFEQANGVDLYPTVLDKAANLFFDLCESNYFKEGERYLSLLLTISFLNLCGYSIYMSEEVELDEDQLFLTQKVLQYTYDVNEPQSKRLKYVYKYLANNIVIANTFQKSIPDLFSNQFGIIKLNNRQFKQLKKDCVNDILLNSNINKLIKDMAF